MGGRFCCIDRTLKRIRRVARIWQRKRLFWKFDPTLLFSLTQIFIGFDLDWGAVKIQWSSKKKRSSPKFKRFFWPKSQIQRFFPPKNRWSPKKKGLGRQFNYFFFCIIIPMEFGSTFDRTLCVFFLSSTSAQISMGGRSISMGGRVSPSPLQFKYCVYCRKRKRLKETEIEETTEFFWHIFIIGGILIGGGGSGPLEFPGNAYVIQYAQSSKITLGTDNMPFLPFWSIVTILPLYR